MSIKIYRAYRIPYSNYYKFTDEFEKVCWNQTKMRLIEQVKKFSPWKFMDWYSGKMDQLRSFEGRLFHVIEWICEIGIIPASESPYKNFLNYDFGFWGYLDSEYIYIIPNVPQYLWYDLIDLYGIDCVSYECWNNTDKPENISDDDWELRGNKWEFLLQQKPLYYTGLSAKDGKYLTSFSLFDLIKDDMKELCNN